jgi:hypothetical protein
LREPGCQQNNFQNFFPTLVAQREQAAPMQACAKNIQMTEKWVAEKCLPRFAGSFLQASVALMIPALFFCHSFFCHCFFAKIQL